jgi:hypothetical protein
MVINFLFYTITIIALFILAVIVYTNNPRSKINVYFSIFTLLGLFWALIVFLTDYIRIYDLAFLLMQLAVIPPALMAPTFLFLSIYFPHEKIKFKKLTVFLIYLPAIILSFLAFTKYNVVSITFRDNWTDFQPGPLYLLIFVEFLCYMGLGLYILLRKLKQSRGIERLQITYLWVGAILTIIVGVITNLILPLLNLGISSVYGPLCTLIFASFTTYAILRYRLMDIKVIIRRSAVFTVLVLIMTVTYSILAYLLSLIFTNLFGFQSFILNGVVTAILVALGFEPLKKALSEITDSFLFKAEYKPQEVLAAKQSVFYLKSNAPLIFAIRGVFLS